MAAATSAGVVVGAACVEGVLVLRVTAVVVEWGAATPLGWWWVEEGERSVSISLSSCKMVMMVVVSGGGCGGDGVDKGGEDAVDGDAR